MKKKKRQGTSVVFNYSKIELTDSMESLLNKGLNYAIVPDKVDLNDLLTNFNRFKRTMLWIEYWANSGNVAAEDDEDCVGNILLQIWKLRFSHKVKLLFLLWAQGLVKILKLKFSQDLKLEFGQYFAAVLYR